MFLTRISQKAKTTKFARSVGVRDAARRAFIAVDTDQRLRRAAHEDRRLVTPIGPRVQFKSSQYVCRLCATSVARLH